MARRWRWPLVIGVLMTLAMTGEMLLLAHPATADTSPTIPVTTAIPVSATPTTAFDPSLYTVPTATPVTDDNNGLSDGYITFLVVLGVVGFAISLCCYLAGWRRRWFGRREPGEPWYMNGWYRKDRGEPGRWF